MGPLTGYRVLELAGIGPAPFACMMLSDLGADVLRVDRLGGRRQIEGLPANVLDRGRRSVAVDLKNPEGPGAVLRLVEAADALVEGFRPGVAERLGIGPDAALRRNPRLVYGRMTGWGQDGPYAAMAGHDINYIALAGALAHIGRAGQPPVPPLNLVGDFGGGGMLLAFGVVCALLEASRSGQGQVVDAAMVDGSAILMSMMHGLSAMGLWSEERGANLLDGGAHFYDVYETADGGYVSIGSIEPQFYAELLRLTGLEAESDLPAQMDRSQWPAMKERLAAVFRTRTRDQWCELMEGTDVCFAPVLTMREAARHPHNQARNTFVEVEGVTQPAPAPRFSRTPGGIAGPPAVPGAHTDEALTDWGLSDDEIAKLRSLGALG
jgi:alpha-methylacyl-CoA racemase